MWARLESNTIVEILTRPKALNIGGTQYPSNIFSMWTDAELATIGIVPVTIDNTNLKDKEYYINTDHDLMHIILKLVSQLQVMAQLQQLLSQILYTLHKTKQMVLVQKVK